MSQRFMSPGQIVGYDFTDGKATLIVTLDDKMATKMMADEWAVEHDDDLGYFVRIEKTE